MQACDMQPRTCAPQPNFFPASVEVVLDPREVNPMILFHGKKVPTQKLMQSEMLVTVQASHIGVVSLPLSHVLFKRWLHWSSHRDYEVEDLALTLEVRCRVERSFGFYKAGVASELLSSASI